MMELRLVKEPDSKAQPKTKPAYKHALYGLVYLCLFIIMSASAHAELSSSGQVQITGIKPKSEASITIENNHQTYQSIANKNGEAGIYGQFPENPEAGISGGVNYTLKYSVAYRDLDDRRRSLENEITFSFSTLAGDLIFLGRTSDTALIEFASGSSEMQKKTASAAGIFKSAIIRNNDFNKHKQGSAFIIITNTHPISGDPLPPVYIEASFSIAKTPSRLLSREGMSALYSNVSEGLFTFPDSKIGGAWGKGMKDMAREFSTNMMAQIAAVGALYDGYSVNTAIRRTQILHAETAQRQMPSVYMCKFPSLGKSLARGTFAASANTQIYAKYMQDYDMQHVDSAGAMQSNFRERDYVQKFREHYCHDQQNGPDGLSKFCEGAGSSKDRVNYDVNFPYFFSTRQGNNVDFLDAPDLISGQPGGPALTDGELDLIQLTKNLYGSRFRTLKENIFHSADGSRLVTELRSLQAIRNVAKNSFAVLVGNRSGGTTYGVHKDDLGTLLERMGVNQDAESYYGVQNGQSISYDGMMEVLTKKIYQDPAFYANLYDNPENVMRQKTAIKAIHLMQGWDVVKALHRREMLLAMILEVKLRREQKRVELLAN